MIWARPHSRTGCFVETAQLLKENHERGDLISIGFYQK